jgi:hypothetical protein
VTAGLKCPPEICPTAYAVVRTDSPKAKDTPKNPIPRLGNAAASTAAPQPPKVSQNVPKNSAVVRSMVFLFMKSSPREKWHMGVRVSPA